MSCAIKNEKGLSGRCERAYLASRDSLGKAQAKLASDTLLSPNEKDQAVELVEALLGLQKHPKPMYRSGRRPGQPAEEWATMSAWPSGWVNEQQPVGMTPQEARAEWALAQRIRAAMALGLPALEKIGIPLSELEANAPKASSLKKTSAWTVEEAGAHLAANAGFAWAIWMGGARELGYMDDKKRPAGAASARLFESAAAASRTAKAARFGGDRGPAAIVKLRIEPTDIVEASPGAGDEVRMELASIEARSLESAMEEASLDRLREALGEGPGREAPAPQPEGSLAGAESGFAVWRDTREKAAFSTPSGGGDSSLGAGFINYKGELGPLVGATLHASAQKAKSAYYVGYGGARDAIVRVRSQPAEVCALIGEPNVKELQSAIEAEEERNTSAALAKADASALRARAASLESGAAQPAPRRSRSL